MNLRRLQRTIEAIGEGLPPKDDWMPTLILESKKANSIFGFVGDSMGGDLMKDITADQITRCIAEFKPDCACFITTAWSLEFEEGEVGELQAEMMRSGKIRASQHPDRIEIVNAYCYGEKGESEGEALMIGYIQRFKDRGPKIKKWKIIEEDASATGRFPDAIKEGFRKARGG
jgi:hypothetical protein